MPSRLLGKRHAETASIALAAAVFGVATLLPLARSQTPSPAPLAPPAPARAPRGPETRAAIRVPAAAPVPLNPPAPANPPLQPGGLMDHAANAGAQIYVDDSFAAVEKIRAADRYASQGQSQLAIQAYQDIINTFGQKLVYLHGDAYQSITDYVREKLLAMPAVQAGMYDQLFGIQARKEVDAALEQRDLPDLIRLCNRYFPSQAGFDGLSHAAEWYFERGEFSAASRLWQQLLTHPAALSPDAPARAMLLFRAAIAESLNQNKPAAEALRQRLHREFPHATGNVDGRQTALLPKLDAILALPPPQQNARRLSDNWPQFQGGPSRSLLPDVHASVGAQLWAADLRDGSSTDTLHQAPATAAHPGAVPPRPEAFNPSAAPAVQALNSYPTLSDGMLFINNGERVIALSANAGGLLWAYPQQLPAHVASPRSYRARFVAQQETAAMRPAAHNSASVRGNRVFAVLPAFGPPAGDTDDIDISAFMPDTRLVCLDRADGHERWSTPAGSIKVEGKGRLAFIGSPIVTRQGVYVMARKLGESAFVQLYLVRLDPDSGTPSWSCYLSSASAGAYFGPFVASSTIPIPTFADDTLYVSTGQGADCAVEASDGRILWLHITDAAKQSHAPADYGQHEFDPSWKFNPPLVHGDLLITSEVVGTDRVLHLYNRWTGALLRTITPKDLNPGNDSGDNAFDVVAGIVGSKLILTGNRAFALNLNALPKASSLLWQTDFPEHAGKPAGRPFLSAAGLYVPFENGMALFNTTTGAAADFWQWPETGPNTRGKPGNFLVTNEQVVVVNDQEIDGYSKWETARDNRLAQIKQRPDDPEPYLSLAEISFRTSHFDLAEQNMKRAVELASAPAAPPASPSAAATADSAPMLARLYHTNLSFAEQLVDKSDAPLRDRARFYFEQCRATARTPEQQAEWRLSMANLSLLQHKPDEAASLYNEVLIDPALRATPFHRGDTLSRAGVAAELKFRALIDRHGPQIYKRFEDLAAALLTRGQNQHDPALLQQVVNAYPNSHAALAAASALVDLYRDKQDWLAELKVLRWLYPHATPDIKPRVTAELALAHAGLKRFDAAMRWADRGLRQYKDWTGTDPATHQSFTFASLRDRLHALGAGIAEERRPTLPPPQLDAHGRAVGPPLMDEDSAKKPIALGALLVPIEQSPALRRPDLFFIYRQGRVHIFHAADGSQLSSPAGIELPENGPAQLLGSSGDISVFVQAHTAIGIDTHAGAIAWQIPFTLTPEQLQRENQMSRRGRIVQQAALGGRIIIQGGGRLIINGNVINANDPQVARFAVAGAVDPETARQFAFAQLQNPAFSTMRIINGRLLVLSGGAMTCYDLPTGKPAWKKPNGDPLPVKLAGGFSSIVFGNEDLVAVQVDSPDRLSSSFLIYDADTGHFRKQINLDSERTLWRTISDDGTLFLVTDQAVVAYDLFSDQDQPLWRRSDIQSRFPYATRLTLDGLVLINANNEVVCLSPEGGEARWPLKGHSPVPLDMVALQGEIPYLRATADGDTVIYQWITGISAFFTYPQPHSDDQEAWGAVFNKNPGSEPPLVGFQVSDPYIVALGSGPLGNDQRDVRLLFFNRKGGLLHLERSIASDTGATGTGPGQGPVIHAWQVVDTGIVFDVGGQIHFYHAPRPK